MPKKKTAAMTRLYWAYGVDVDRNVVCFGFRDRLDATWKKEKLKLTRRRLVGVTTCPLPAVRIREEFARRRWTIEIFNVAP
jgi:hypothetical protein